VSLTGSGWTVHCWPSDDRPVVADPLSANSNFWRGTLVAAPDTASAPTGLAEFVRN
jgi:hypothetical protein